MTFWTFNTVVKLFVRSTNIQGLERLRDLNKSFIISANHRGKFDGIWIWYYIAKMNRKTLVDMRIVTGERFFRKLLLGWYLKKMRCFPVEKGRGVNILDPLIDVLKQGGLICIFPEGKMQKHPNDKGDAKRGVGYLIWKSKAPVIPIYVNYIKKSKYIPIWEMTFIVGEPHKYNIQSEDDLKKYSDKVLNLSYELKI
jgi:1-acyl-sn-glycerol-3-phosphate acyltransferase